ncbi:hypothetical protein MKK68_02420 [Methylobacterium sp. E-016]|jgi:hypothetical protein|uniref:hypothetical protein n=1 Tax=unclassified Methylobacterium TaxID=2615210 RepID=UPI0011CCB0E6|nr:MULTISPECIES: hypothetical protein [unclassified Methylobacterium]MCJ2009863.1 hypothetical protein [Methylobacterium sp. J-092]MCJ2074512.1 hypothetical protein [Methylobacterium sp. E-016]TXN64637.1 hypothetical protein FV230_18105 [Methylobacterium sp. WL6]
MSGRTKAHNLTREEGAGYSKALQDMRTWYEGHNDLAKQRIETLKTGLGATDPASITAVAMLESAMEDRQQAVAEIDRLYAQQRIATLGR